MVIVGAGAIGSWLAARLVLGGRSVTLLSRPAAAAQLSRDGLVLETAPAADPASVGSRRIARSPGLVVADAPARVPKDPELVVFCVRAYQTVEAARQLAAAGVRPAAVLTLQNGLGNAEALQATFAASKVCAGTTTHGVTRLGVNMVRHAGAGDTVIGPWTTDASGAAYDAAALLSSCGIGTTVVADPRPALWTKVAVNAAINPATALLGVPNGALLDGGPLERDLAEAAHEVARVARAEGVAVSGDACAAAARQVAQRTAENLSSMLQAKRAGRPLETDAILGEVVRRARRHGLAVPVVARYWERLVPAAPA